MMLLRVVFRNTFRNPLRTTLTVLGIAVAVLAFGLLRTLIGAWHAGVAASAANRLVTRNAVSLVFPLPISYLERLRQIEGVTRVSYGNWFGGIYLDEKNFFPNFVVEPRSYLEMYPEFILGSEEKESFLKDRKGCVAGRKIARLFGWEVGDTVTLRGTIFPGEWDLVLRGIYRGRDRSIDETLFFFHWDYVNETLREAMPRRADKVGFFTVSVRSPEIAAEVGAAIDNTFKNSLAETLTETEKAFQQSFVAMSSALIVVIQIVSVLVIGIILAVVANTMVMSTRERSGEYAVFKCLGFGGVHLAGLILGESVVLTGSGCLLGIVLTFPAAGLLQRELSNFFPVFHVTPGTIGTAFLAAMLVALGASVLPTRSAVRIRIAEGLARVG